jgi:transporter family-2 protein
MLPMQARVNAGLSVRIDDGVQAGVLSSVAGLVFIAILALLLPSVRHSIAAIPAAVRTRAFPRWSMLSGAIGAYWILGQGVAAGVLGIALFTIANVAGQTLGGIAMDLWGIGPAGRRRVTWSRILGATVIVIAVAWAVAPIFAAPAPAAGGFPLLLLLLPFTAGLLNGLQTVMNGLQTAHYRSFIPAALINFILGTLLLALLAAVRAVGDGNLSAPPVEPWYYLGGPLGVMCVGLAAYLAKHLGILLTSLGMIAGQLIGALVLEALWPADVHAGSLLQELFATVLAVAGVVIASVERRTASRGITAGAPPALAAAGVAPRS